jgi:hypothetical protein
VNEPRHGWSLDQLIARQDGIASRAQLLAAGVDDRAMSRRIRAGQWRRVLTGVYQIGPETLTLERRRIAAALYAGPRGQLTGSATLLKYGFTSPLASDRIHVLMPHEMHRRSTGFVVIQRTLSMDDETRDVGLYQITSPVRAVVDACRLLSDLQVVRAIMTEAVQRAFVSIEALDEEIHRAARSRTALARRVLPEIVAGVRSAPEAELRVITSRSTILPTVLWNPCLVNAQGTRLPRPDAWIPDAAMGLEVNSWTYHAGRDGWDSTLSRSNDLIELGAAVVHITPTEIQTRPARVLRRIERTYLARVGMGSTVPITVVEEP